jgi:hypothetical protein
MGNRAHFSAPLRSSAPLRENPCARGFNVKQLREEHPVRSVRPNGVPELTVFRESIVIALEED